MIASNRGASGLPLLLIVLLGGCASGGGSGPTMAATSPVVSVERFLQAANVQDLDAMARIFGTYDGPMADQTGSTVGCAFRRMGSWIRLSSRCGERRNIELRMNAIAEILRHDAFSVRSEVNVPGRSRPAIRVGVDMTHGNFDYTDVPFVVVQARDGRWLVEQIGLDRITGEA